MDFEQKEKLIRTLVEEVLNKLINSSKIDGEKSHFLNKLKDSWHTEKTLLTASDADTAIKKGFKKIIVSSETIITPLAKDIFKENGLKIVKFNEEKKDSKLETVVEAKGKKIAILSNYDDEAYKIKTKNIIQKHEIDVDCLSPKNFTASELQLAVDNLSESVLSGKYFSGIVISQNSYQLMKSQKKNGDLKTKICWEIDGNKACSATSNILFINSSLIGFKQLEVKISTWIKYNQ